MSDACDCSWTASWPCLPPHVNIRPSGGVVETDRPWLTLFGRSLSSRAAAQGFAADDGSPCFSFCCHFINAAATTRLFPPFPPSSPPPSPAATPPLFRDNPHPYLVAAGRLSVAFVGALLCFGFILALLGSQRPPPSPKAVHGAEPVRRRLRFEDQPAPFVIQVASAHAPPLPEPPSVVRPPPPPSPPPGAQTRRDAWCRLLRTLWSSQPPVTVTPLV
ncbi:hypothetical protein EMIHUDRAFT_355322 [Emiliania huxleyi CCMP1516]|uniref:Uncharacterized protein n=2 Tax=Emiliania huxleyi TaxID=2903 RepID=A0A0D3J985_EMIH1|nr:hypothetical protein EMIHUDRAFT_355322 [Emiliania huxleyi CCMP1516]EOD20070.1 hypothetical protein EMIHUDRAFT_355322 [Emiliania huxleyi CCMP1516]|eukprot:XP_005772499.1 hypothetical protein EMIHUDRAFT_355322 [Emiliania huxleyi CCMP1516]